MISVPIKIAALMTVMTLVQLTRRLWFGVSDIVSAPEIVPLFRFEASRG
jgi:hypothetical protein